MQIHVSIYPKASLVAQMVKNPPPMQETWVQSLGWDDPLENVKKEHSAKVAQVPEQVTGGNAGGNAQVVPP